MSEQDKKKQLAKWVDAHVDGLLKPDQQEKFDRALKSNAQLRDEVATQARIDESLKRQFAAPSAEEIIQRALGEKGSWAASNKGSRRQWWTPAVKYASIAAAFLIIAGGGAWYWFEFAGGSSQVTHSGTGSRELLAVFEESVAAGFKPKWVCKTDKQFFLTTYNRFGHGLLLTAMPPDIKVLGWSYSTALSPKTAYLLADVRGHQTMVFIDAIGHECAKLPPDGSAMHVYHRTIGDLNLFEMTDLDKPALLEHFYEKQLPDEWEDSVMRQ